AAGRLQVHRDAAGEGGEPLDLRRLGPSHQLDVDVPREAVALAKQLEGGDEVVHDLHRIAGDAGGDEESIDPAALQRAEEDAHQLLGLEQRAGQIPVPPHWAV